MFKSAITLLLSMSLAQTAIASGSHGQPSPSKYAGQETRAIKSLSTADIEGITTRGRLGPRQGSRIKRRARSGSPIGIKARNSSQS